MNRATRKQQREVKRAIKAFQYRAKPGENEKNRRMQQMVHGTLTPENGVVREYMCDNPSCQHTVKAPGLCEDCAVKVREHWREATLRQRLAEGTEGQDRESYSDDQDRESYSVEDGDGSTD